MKTKKINVYLGIDVGSVTTKAVLINEKRKVVSSVYLHTSGDPMNAIQECLKIIEKKYPKNVVICGVGTTGSARKLAGIIVGADLIKNEITAHAVAALNFNPKVQTILEIGGQDSKIIILRKGVVVDFAMNTVCAAGTGSFLDHQATRLKIPIEKFGDLALKSKTKVNIAGRCTVFAESDMVHKAQVGHKKEDIINGLCNSLVRNYLNNVAKGKEIKSPIVFQGGVAANKGIKKAFEISLEQKVIVPKEYEIMGAIGVAILAMEETEGKQTNFKGFNKTLLKHEIKSFECTGCPNLCEIINIFRGKDVLARWGSRCGKHNT